MQKKLLAVAVGTALAAGAFVAQADTTLYGKMHVSVDWFDVDGDESYNHNGDGFNVSSNSSRLGVKGAHDLGNGLKAIYQVEGSINADESGGVIDSRNTFGGFSGGWGTAVVGRHDTPYKLATLKLDPFGDTVGDYNGIIGQVNGTNIADLRAPNVIAYISPTFSGMHVAAAYTSYGLPQSNPVAPAPAATGTGADNQEAIGWSVMGMYDQGPLFLSLAYEVLQDAGGEGIDHDAFKVGGGFTMGALKFGLVWESLGGDIDALSRDAWWATASYAMGNNTFALNYGQAGDTDNSDGTGADMLSIGWFNKLSKQTQIYVAYARMANDDLGRYNLGVSGHGDVVATTPGADSQSLSVGTIIDF